MSAVEHIGPGDWIRVGNEPERDAVVCTIRPGRVEVVYLDDSHKAMHQEVEWRRGLWQFAGKKGGGVPADKDARLEKYVKILRAKK